MAIKGKQRKKKVKFYKKDFKLPESTQKKLKYYCNKYSTTQNKVFRKALNEFLKRNLPLNENHQVEVSPNQLSLFE